MDECSNNKGHVNTFGWCIFELLEVDVKIQIGDQTTILLTSLHESYDVLVYSLLKVNITLKADEVLKDL